MIWNGQDARALTDARRLVDNEETFDKLWFSQPDEASMSADSPAITSRMHDAVLFDLDGVLTRTASIHARCWKHMFDEFLGARSACEGEDHRPFDLEADYKLHVDGKPRDDGVRDFLRSRGIELPDGQAGDPPGRETVRGLGNRKNELIGRTIAEYGVEPFEDAVGLVRRLREQGIRTAVVSSSRNCEPILRAAGIADLFELWVDGAVAEKLGLRGKPAPDTFLEAARQLGVDPRRAVVVEDAVAGVEAGRAGDFALVVGVDRDGVPDGLHKAGADVVVDDLAAVG
jgi:beta-phosphoglucomutase family hydrolase